MASRKEYRMDFVLNAQLNGSFGAAATKAQKEFAKIGAEIEKLNKIQKDVSSYQKQQQAVDNTASRLENLQRQHDLLQREIQETDGDTSALEREKLKLEQRIESTSQTLQTQQGRLDATGQRLQENGVDTANLTEESRRLTEELERLSQEQDDVANHGATMGESFVQAMGSMGEAIDILDLTGKFEQIKTFYEDCIRLAAELQATMSNVQAISGAGGDEMVELTEKAKTMGATTKFTANEAAEAYSYMARHTWPTARRLAA